LLHDDAHQQQTFSLSRILATHPDLLMPESMHKLTGQITSIETGNDYDEEGYEVCWVDLALKLIEGHMVNVHYSFDRGSVRDNIRNSVQKGMTITVSVVGQADLDGKFDYTGIGAIQVHDLLNELDRYVRVKFGATEKDYFTEREVALINRLLTTAKDRIKEIFKPSELGRYPLSPNEIRRYTHQAGKALFCSPNLYSEKHRDPSNILVRLYEIPRSGVAPLGSPLEFLHCSLSHHHRFC
jgi:hypothetical protein